MNHALREHSSSHRNPSLPSTASVIPPTPDLVGPVPSAEGRSLVLVQSQRVVCVVEGGRQVAALSVARLLCRLLLSETFVYVCSREEAARLSVDRSLKTVPETWSEIYRATPWADAAIGIH